VPIRTNSPAPKASDHPACGMWAEREDLGDPVTYVRKIRQNRFAKLLKGS
jgi:hypothetical protein